MAQREGTMTVRAAIAAVYADLVRQRQLHHECNEHHAADLLDAEARGVSKAQVAVMAALDALPAAKGPIDLGPRPNCPRCKGTGEADNSQFRCACRWDCSPAREDAEKALPAATKKLVAVYCPRCGTTSPVAPTPEGMESVGTVTYHRDGTTEVDIPIVKEGHNESR